MDSTIRNIKEQERTEQQDKAMTGLMGQDNGKDGLIDER